MNPVVVNERRGDRIIPLVISERVAWLYSLKDGQEVDANMTTLLLGASAGYQLGFSDATERASKIISSDRD